MLITLEPSERSRSTMTPAALEPVEDAEVAVGIVDIPFSSARSLIGFEPNGFGLKGARAKLYRFGVVESGGTVGRGFV